MTAMVRGLLAAGVVLVAMWRLEPGRTPVFAQNVVLAPAAPRQQRSQEIDPLTASIYGRITTADSGAPIRRAEVRAMSGSGINRLATTDGEGRFELRDLPAGEYRVIVSKSGFVPLTSGQRRAFDAPRPIDLRQGQRVAANIALPRAGAITGRVYDEAGEPIADLQVQALRLRTAEGRRRLEPVGAADRSDDIGSFRLYGLPPGNYYVTAASPRRPETVWMGGGAVRTAAAPDRSALMVFYPGTTNSGEALPVAVSASGEARADMQISNTRASTVSGTVFTSSGAPAIDATLTLRSTSIAVGASLAIGPPPLMFSGHTNADGTFSIANVPAGSYALTATLRMLPPAVTVVRTTAGDTAIVDPDSGRVTPLSIAMRPETASIPLVVTDADLTGLSITTRTPGTIAGSFVADAGVTQPLPERLGVTVGSLLGGESMMQSGGSRTFRLAGVNGLATLSVQGLPEGWTVKSIIVDGTDRTDEPLDFRNGGTSDVQIVLTDRITVVSGSVIDDAPPRDDVRRDYTVIVFPEDTGKWTYPSRYVRSSRTDEQGTFRISALPPERYLAVAVDFIEDGEWTDPEFLERIRQGATSFSLADAERRNLDLRVVKR